VRRPATNDGEQNHFQILFMSGLHLKSPFFVFICSVFFTIGHSLTATAQFNQGKLSRHKANVTAVWFAKPEVVPVKPTSSNSTTKPTPVVLYEYYVRTLAEISNGKFSADTTTEQTHFTSATLGEDLFSTLTRYCDPKTGKVEFGQLEAFMQDNYYDYRGFIKRFSALENKYDYRNKLWLQIPIESSVTETPRMLYVSKKYVFQALLDYAKNGKKLKYPVGTMFMAETQTTNPKTEDPMVGDAQVMIKRPDANWDFFIFNLEEGLSRRTIPEARKTLLPVPAACVRCHSSKTVLEPFKSFPVIAPKNAVILDDGFRNPIVFDFFKEAETKADFITGPYASMLVSKILSEKKLNQLTLTDQYIYDKLKPLFPELF
jgi:hypothetical protein